MESVVNKDLAFGVKLAKYFPKNKENHDYILFIFIFLFIPALGYCKAS
jgi:hypothetical protein